MNGFISDEIVEQIRVTSDIVEIIGEHISLKKSGKNYKGLCPFHQEKTPSFTVSPDKQIFHCFGCSGGGNVFSFLMRFNSLSFPEAVARLGTRYGIAIHSDKRRNNSEFKQAFSQKEREKDYTLNKLAAEYFRNNLIKEKCGKAAREYLNSRNISPDVSRKFFVGYANENWNSLLNYFEKQNADLRVLEKVGLIKSRESKKGYYDRYRGRIIFPIFSFDNKVCGFGGRDITHDGKAPKYINSPDSVIYNKGKILFGLNFAKESIRESGVILIVEGYFDLISLYQHGIKNTVAVCGTALTESQAGLIKRYTNNAILLFDSDQAGLKATYRGFEVLLKHDLNVKVVDFPDKMDPDDFINQYGLAEFQKKTKESLPFIEFLANKIARKIDLNSLEERLSGLNDILPFVAKIENCVERTEYVTKIAEIFRVSDRSLQEELRKAVSKNKKITVVASNVKPVAKKRSFDWSERNLIRLMILDPGCIERIKAKISSSCFVNTELKEIAEILFCLIIQKDQLSPQKIVELFPSANKREIITELLIETIEFDNPNVVLEDCVKAILKKAKAGEVKNLKKQRIQAASFMKVAEFHQLDKDLKSLQ